LAGLALGPLLFGLPPLLLPAHVVLMEMVIDPICSIAFEGAREERNIMTRPPRRLNEPLAGRPQLIRAGVQGGLLLAICLTLYGAQVQSGVAENEARATTLIALTIGNLGLVLASLSTRFSLLRLGDREMRPFWLIASIALGALDVAIIWPPAADLLSFALPDWSGVGLGVGCGLAAFLAFELVKRVSTDLKDAGAPNSA
jgi:Ca2+-transporting ATPase